jgi:hypothetical protein
MERGFLQRRNYWLFTLFSLSILLFLSACGALSPAGQQTQRDKAALDAELARARQMGVPETLLAPIQQQENRIAQGVAPAGLFGDQNPASAYNNASTSYQVLLAETINVEIQAAQLAQHQADLDIGNFADALQLRQNEQYPQVPDFQARLAQGETEYAQAQTPNDYAKVSAFATTQTQALYLLGTAKEQLDQFKSALNQMHSAGLNTILGQQEYQDDLNTFATSNTPDQVTKLQDILGAQLDQLVADQTAAIPYVGKAMLQNFQNLIDQAKLYGEDITTFQQEHDQDVTALGQATSLQQYLQLSAQIQSQTGSMHFILVRGKARYDLKTLKTLIGQTKYDNDYEYLDGDDAYNDESARLNAARTQQDYQQIDDQLTILLNNINALLTNLKDPNYNKHDQPHQVDMQLMQEYNLTRGKVLIVSLTEQTAREYENGKLVHWMYVVTGQRALPSPPGLWPIIFKESHILFKSAEPPDSPFWYPPTPINYAAEYHAGGFFYHDATWRVYFGPGANLPHDDYTSGQYSDNGTHGCINMQLAQAQWLYSWLQTGTPTIVF